MDEAMVRMWLKWESERGFAMVQDEMGVRARREAIELEVPNQDA